MVLGETSIREDGQKGSSVATLSVAALLVASLVGGCGGPHKDASGPPGMAQAQSEAQTIAPSTTGEGTVGVGNAEILADPPFVLNESQPVPQDFEAAYQRGALIAVEFYKAGQDPFYPQGLEVDAQVDNYFGSLSSQYPTVEFFTYEISNRGAAQTSRDLRPGEYGTLASQLGVGFTPFVATLAPEGDRYVIENLFQGYVSEPVLSQALFDLASNPAGGNTSDVDVTLTQFELTESGGGVEYFSVRNRTRRPVNLQGFSLRVLDPETADVSPDSPGVQINEEIRVRPDASVSIGRVPDIVDANGRRVAGTFEGGQDLDLSPGDQVALLDSGGAVAATFTV